MKRVYTCGEGDTLDTWRPSHASPDEIIQSEWRKNQIGKNYNQRPGLDEVKKIKAYIKRKASDAEIMRVFGINAETLIAIKKNRYSPTEGILPERSLTRYQMEKIESLEKAVKFIADVLFISEEAMEEYRAAIGYGDALKFIKKEYDDFDEEADAEG